VQETKRVLNPKGSGYFGALRSTNHAQLNTILERWRFFNDSFPLFTHLSSIRIAKQGSCVV
jgi:hypothetical protein